MPYGGKRGRQRPHAWSASEREDDHDLGLRRRVGRGGRVDRGAKRADRAVPGAADDAGERAADREARPRHAARVGIAVDVTDNAGNATAGEMSEMSLRVGGRTLRGGAASVSYSRSAGFSGRLATRDGLPLAGQPIAVDRRRARAGSSPSVVGTVTTDAKGRFTYRAPAGPSRRLRFIFAGVPGFAPLTRSAQLRVRATSTIHASPARCAAAGAVLGAPRPARRRVPARASSSTCRRSTAAAGARSRRPGAGVEGRVELSYRFAGTRVATRSGCGSAAKTSSPTTSGTRARSSFASDEAHLRAAAGDRDASADPDLPRVRDRPRRRPARRRRLPDPAGPSDGAVDGGELLPAIILAVDAYQHRLGRAGLSCWSSSAAS